MVHNLIAALLAGGHVLIEDVPGVGKTTLAMTFARALSLDYKRTQFTPDVLPSDILGFSMYNSATKEFEYRKILITILFSSPRGLVSGTVVSAFISLVSAVLMGKSKMARSLTPWMALITLMRWMTR